MTWVDGHICVSHPREPWESDTPPIIVQNRLDVMKGPKRSPQFDAYSSAKMHFTMGAAEEVVRRCLTVEARDKIVAYTIGRHGLDARIVIPHPPFDDTNGDAIVSPSDVPINALPFAYAAYLSRTIGCPIDREIVQNARVGRTKLTKWPRYLFQPQFGGVVRPRQAYILVDDVVSTGGTFAALRSYIVRNGGRVVFATALANGTGQHQEFAVSKQTVNLLLQFFGGELDQFWTETIGHGIGCLTEPEARFLGEWSNEQEAEGCPRGPELLQRLRAKLDEAAAKQG